MDDRKKRITEILMESWEDSKGMKTLPSDKDLNPDSLEDVLENCFIINIGHADDGKYNYKFVGDKILEAYGSDMTKRKDYEKGNPLSYKDKILRIQSTKSPLIDEGQFTNYCGNIVKYRQCLLPLSRDGVNVDTILGGMRFKIFPAQRF